MDYLALLDSQIDLALAAARAVKSDDAAVKYLNKVYRLRRLRRLFAAAL